MSHDIDPLVSAKLDVQETILLMQDNMHKVMKRDEQLGSLEDKAEEVRASAKRFQIVARQARRHMCYQHLRMTIILGTVIAITLLILILIILRVTGVI
jgi:hypothetical protein